MWKAAIAILSRLFLQHRWKCPVFHQFLFTKLRLQGNIFFKEQYNFCWTNKNISEVVSDFSELQSVEVAVFWNLLLFGDSKEEPSAMYGHRFSKSAAERETMLGRRKEHMLEQARR